MLLIGLVLWDTAETVILPRTVSRKLGLTNVYFTTSYLIYIPLARLLKPFPLRREQLLGAYGPLAMLGLIGLWVGILILGFGLVQWGLGTPLTSGNAENFPEHLYMSATTFFTLGYGDVTATTGLGRTLAVIEAGLGLGFLAVVISYLPVLYQSFSRREATILLLDARAGSPPTACEMLKRYGGQDLDGLEQLLAELERWSANLLETYLSYPILAYYRSQHEKMSWLGALACIMDTCSILRLGFLGEESHHHRLIRQAELSYALARHVCVDLAYILAIPPDPHPPERLTEDDWRSLHSKLVEVDIPTPGGDAAYRKLKSFRAEYEPYLHGLGRELFLNVPGFSSADGERDSWQTSAWDSKDHF